VVPRRHSAQSRRGLLSSNRYNPRRLGGYGPSAEIQETAAARPPPSDSVHLSHLNPGRRKQLSMPSSRWDRLAVEISPRPPSSLCSPRSAVLSIIAETVFSKRLRSMGTSGPSCGAAAIARCSTSCRDRPLFFDADGPSGDRADPSEIRAEARIPLPVGPWTRCGLSCWQALSHASP